MPERETLKCVLCGGGKTETVYRFSAANVVRCAGCGLVFASRIPDAASVEEEYSAEYFDKYYSSAAGGGDGQTAAALAVLARLERHRPGKGKLLDVGFGAGGYLRAARDAGWEPFGVDVSAAAVEAARRRGLQALAGPLERAGFGPDTFDAAIAIHSLEHYPDPVLTLREIRRVLKPGGVILVSVPNFNGARARRLGAKWDGLQIGRHFYFFTKNTLGKMVEAAGFEALELESSRPIVSGAAVDRALGRGLGRVVRRAARKLLGPAIDCARAAASTTAEDDSIVLTAVKNSGKV